VASSTSFKCGGASKETSNDGFSTTISFASLTFELDKRLFTMTSTAPATTMPPTATATKVPCKEDWSLFNSFTDDFFPDLVDLPGGAGPDLLGGAGPPPFTFGCFGAENAPLHFPADFPGDLGVAISYAELVSTISAFELQEQYDKRID